MIPAQKIIVAMDICEKPQLSQLLETLAGTNVWLKFGMEAFYTLGPSAIEAAKARGFKVFLDLKLHDIPNTVANALKSISSLSVDMVNLHASGGSEMMKKASGAVRELTNPPLLIAVTQLTSTSQRQMNEEQRIKGDVLESVVHYAKLAKESGCDGVVSSPLEVQAIKLICGSRFITVTPGIRPEGAATQDQIRVTTPLEALRLGTDFMVIGRPITDAPDPRAALLNIIQGS